VVVLLGAFLNRTLHGKAVLATAADLIAAKLVGVNTAAVVGFSFAVSGVIGALAGVLITPITLTSYDVGTLLALKGFAAAMLGGIGSPLGAVVGGLLVGLIEAFGAGCSRWPTRTRSRSSRSCSFSSSCHRVSLARAVEGV